MCLLIRLTWSDARDGGDTPGKQPGHQGTPAINTRSRQQSIRRSLFYKNTDEPVTDRENIVPDKVSSDRENSMPVEHILDSDSALSPARQSIAAVSDNFKPMQASTPNSRQTTRRLTRQSIATFQSLANLTVGSSESEDEGNSEVIRGLLSSTPHVIARSSPVKSKKKSKKKRSRITMPVSKRKSKANVPQQSTVAVGRPRKQKQIEETTVMTPERDDVITYQYEADLNDDNGKS